MSSRQLMGMSNELSELKCDTAEVAMPFAAAKT
jgi:hypothetical protein